MSTTTKETPKVITQTLQMIQEHTGVVLTHDQHFPKLRRSGGVQWFCAMLNESTTERDTNSLYSYAKRYGTISVSPNGYNRLAIHILKK